MGGINMTDRYTKIILTLIALFLGSIIAIQLGYVQHARAVAVNVAVDQIIDAMRADHKQLAQLIENKCK
jgi:hypothetical protein